MALCGFCKKKIDLQTGTKKIEASENAVKIEYSKGSMFNISMLSCPHCESILGFV